MRIVSIMWNSYVPMFARVSGSAGADVAIYSTKKLEEDPAMLSAAEKDIEGADLILLYRTKDLFWEGLEKKIKVIGSRIPVVCLGHDPSYWMLSTVRADVVATAQSYLTLNGEENIRNMLLYLRKEVLCEDVAYAPPAQTPWEGIFHPRAPSRHFSDLKSYLEWYKPGGSPVVAMLCSRLAWINQSLDIENAIVEELEARGMSVIPIFSYSVKDPELGTRGMAEIIREFFVDGEVKIDALIKLNPFFLGSGGGDPADTSKAISGVDLLNRLKVPVFQPIIASYMTLEEWESSSGITNDIGWSVAMPEFEGVIEPIMVGSSSTRSDTYDRKAIRERCSKLAARVRKWIGLKNKPVDRRKVAFILHNNPCASVEASVGGAAHLDSLESVSRILKKMKDAGYAVNPPESGKALIDNIMGRKAISEFRWTSMEEIVKCGGSLAFITPGEYGRWFSPLSDKVKSRMIEAWGNPPGEAKNGIPAAMVYEGKIVVTGISYGNAVVCAQPKRGCAGTRCDGQVCKILHDPDVPPTHQYIATYRYLEDVYGADVLVHVGTHGNVEFLPGKGVGLSADCYPDIAIGTIPHLYIYNADNPPEGTIAKRRSNACLVDHMQTVLTGSGLYDGLEEVDRLLSEYETARHDAARSHALEHLLVDAVKAANLDKEIRLKDGMPLADIVSRAHNALSKIRNTQIQSGMHVFGELPEGEKRIDFIYSIMRYGDDGSSIRHVISAIMGLDLAELLANQERYSEEHKRSYGQLLEDIDATAKLLVGYYLNGGDSIPEELFGEKAGPYRKQLDDIHARVLDIDARVRDSDEVGSLMSGFDGRYIPAGPSGLITKGREDILPTGRNFYSLDPRRVPTRSAWKVGQMLARSIIDKHVDEEGRMPENVAYYWMCNDIMWADGEGMAMIMYLLGVEPRWQSNGRLKSFSVIPLERLGRPRIDVTIRVSGITRDNFPGCIDVIDEAIQAVASLDEPPEMNYPRKHSLEQMAAGTGSWRDATLRVFASKPGTYQSGVNLAVYASAWKDEKDLADVFVYWNGYAYGKGVSGRESHQQFVNSLKTVDTTFNKVVSDEYDLFGCCCYFGTHGGMTAAARHLSGRDVKAYYGDTREPEQVEVRDLADEVRRVVRTKLLNPKWIEGMKEHGYKGAGDMMKRIGRVYGWEASTQEVDDWIFDDITRTFVLDEEMRRFFEENNPYALEEIARRLLEANQRELWNADPELLEKLKEAYLEIEGWMEEKAGEGEYQGGSIDIMTAAEVESWGEKMSAVMEKIHK